MPVPHPDEVLTVSQLTQSLKSLLEGNYRFVHIRGEISSLRSPASGHRYFILKDSSAQVRCVLFRQQERYLSRPVADGQQVICHGRVSVYEQRGEYQIVVDIVEHLGSGALQIAFEELKRRLAGEGLFDASRKKPLPAFPRNVAVITSPTGAAIHDFLTIWRLRKSTAVIKLLPVRVQGTGAGQEIARAIDLAGTIGSIDIIVLCRGGGSMEDLWAFNEEPVARAIAASAIPVVTGIGHEIDFTIADFCADLRAPTPTAAAERILPDTTLLAAKIASYRTKLSISLGHLLTREQRRLIHCDRILGKYRENLLGWAMRLDLCLHRFSRTCQALLQSRERRLAQLEARLSLQTPMHRLQYGSLRLSHLSAILGQRIERILTRSENRLSALAALLNSVSPLATLARGYAIVRKQTREPEDWTVITRYSEVRSGERVNILLGEGSLDCEVVEASPTQDSSSAGVTVSISDDGAGG
jgi:exodeoxyribonuclease VII large subunit